MINNSCEELWYLCVNTICLFLCILALLVLFINQREENSHLSKHKYSSQHVHNPMKILWIWMGANTLAQIIDLIETGLLMGTTPKENCMIIPDNEVKNNIIMFLFAILTMVSGYLATLWYLRKIRRSDDVGRIDEIIRKTEDIHQYSD